MLKKAVICGSGSMATCHANFLKKNGYQIVAVKSSYTERAHKFAKEYNAKLYSSFEEIGLNEEFNVIIICTIPVDHSRDFENALKSNASKILIEKPLASTIAEAEKIYQSSICSDKNISVCYPFIYSKNFHFLKQIISGNKFGILNNIFCNINFLRVIDDKVYPYKWWVNKEKSGGGSIFQVGIHWFNFLFSLLEYKDIQIINKSVHYNSTYNIEDEINVSLISKIKNKNVLVNIAMSSLSNVENKIILFQFDGGTVLYLNGTVFQLTTNSIKNTIKNPIKVFERLSGKMIHTKQTLYPEKFPYNKYMQHFLSSSTLDKSIVRNAYYDVKIIKQIIS